MIKQEKHERSQDVLLNQKGQVEGPDGLQKLNTLRSVLNGQISREYPKGIEKILSYPIFIVLAISNNPKVTLMPAYLE